MKKEIMPEKVYVWKTVLGLDDSLMMADKSIDDIPLEDDETIEVTSYQKIETFTIHKKVVTEVSPTRKKK